jgi:serine/threonine protein kinase
MLEDEMEMLKQVHHPHLVSYLGSTVEYNWISIATECTEGGTLADLLVQESCFSEAFAANVLIQILEGLIYLHKRKIVHKALTVSPSSFFLIHLIVALTHSLSTHFHLLLLMHTFHILPLSPLSFILLTLPFILSLPTFFLLKEAK